MTKISPLISERLNGLAREFVGDGKHLNVYFVSDGPDVVMITYDSAAAYRFWLSLTKQYPLRESSLEDRFNGTLASVEPETDAPGAPLRIYDDAIQLREQE